MSRLLTVLGLALLVAGGLACRPSRHAEGQVYYCPMHPSYTADRPGECPICHMQLVLRAPGTASAAEGGGRRVLFYRHPMTPEVTSPVPAKDSMGMDFVPVYADQAGAGAGPSEEGLRLAGVQTATAVRGALARRLRAAGVVRADERRLAVVEARVGGWIERLQVSAIGERVAAGQTVVSLYSPEVVAAQQEYVLARDRAIRFTGSSLPEVRRGGEDLIVAARRRLEVLGVPPGTIAALERTGVPQRTIPVTAPAAGHVVEKAAVVGARVEPGQPLLTLADLSRVWVEADLYERDASAVAVGQPAVLRLPQSGGERRARVAVIVPFLDPASRTLRIRFELPNPDLELLPGMFVDVELELDSEEAVLVPDSAVLDSGLRQLVFVLGEDGTVRPREVRVGGRSGGQASILAGLAAGERVATGANFLLDADVKLRGALESAVPPAQPPPPPPPAGVAPPP